MPIAKTASLIEPAKSSASCLLTNASFDPLMPSLIPRLFASARAALVRSEIKRLALFSRKTSWFDFRVAITTTRPIYKIIYRSLIALTAKASRPFAKPSTHD
jgi:hypothetical protein